MAVPSGSLSGRAKQRLSATPFPFVPFVVNGLQLTTHHSPLATHHSLHRRIISMALSMAHS